MSYQKLLDDMSYSLSDADLKQLLGNDMRIIKYSQLSDYKSIQQLLPNETFDHIILLVELLENVGHYECIVRVGQSIFFFDSYGVRPDKALLFAKKQFRRELGQKWPLLSYLLNKAEDENFNVMFSTFPYQKKDNYISTCGRWCALFIYYMKHAKPRQQNFTGFHKYVTSQAKKYEYKSLDMWATHATTT